VQKDYCCGYSKRHNGGMRLKSISIHLRPYLMLARRQTTINHMFAAAIAPADIYDEGTIGRAIQLLGQDPERDLECAYCGDLADTWDHVFATVKDSQFSGYGHRLGNLLPCCKQCNSRKGNKTWDAHLSLLGLMPNEHSARHGAIERYIAEFGIQESSPAASPDLRRPDEIRRQVLSLLHEGDLVAGRVRAAHPDIRSEGHALSRPIS
jgi:hypothetical protein